MNDPIELPENWPAIVSTAATVAASCRGIDLEHVTRQLWEADSLGYPLAARGLELVAEWHSLPAVDTRRAA